MEVTVPPSNLLEVICDFERYPEFIRSVLEVEIQDMAADYWRVRFDVALFRKRVSYTLDLRRPNSRRVEWTLVESDWMAQNNGSWTLTELDGGSTRATYTIDVRLKTSVPAAVSGLLIDASFPRVLRDFKRRAEEMAGVD